MCKLGCLCVFKNQVQCDKILNFSLIDFAVNQGQNAGVELKSTQEIGKPIVLGFSCYLMIYIVL